MPTGDPIVLHQANGDSIVSAGSFTELLEKATALVDGTTDTTGMTVTFTEGSGIRAMPLKRALKDYLPDSDRTQLITRLKNRAKASNKLANWLEKQAADEATETTGSLS